MPPISFPRIYKRCREHNDTIGQSLFSSTKALLFHIGYALSLQKECFIFLFTETMTDTGSTLTPLDRASFLYSYYFKRKYAEPDFSLYKAFGVTEFGVHLLCMFTRRVYEKMLYFQIFLDFQIPVYNIKQFCTYYASVFNEV